MGIYKPYSSEREEKSLRAEVFNDSIEFGKYSEDLKAFLDNLKPDKGKVYLLVNAMGAGEYYGSNKNGDFFPEKALIKYYPTFYNAKVYKHHINKEEDENYGDVVFAGWNPRMKRIELIIAIDIEKSPEIGEKVKEGVPIGVSMGTRVPEEICFSKDTIINTTDCQKSIGDIAIGDEVFTHTGKFSKVTSIFNRTVNKYIKLKVFGDYEDIKGTIGHPILIAEKEQFKEGKTIRRKALKSKLVTKWKKLIDCRIGDYVLFKKTIKKPPNNNKINKNIARIFGYYLAEGHIIRQRCGKKKDGHYKIMGVQFHFNKNEKYDIDLCDSLNREKIKYKSYIIEDKNELKIVVYNKELAYLLMSLGGENSQNKYILPKIYGYQDELLLNILGAAIDGDGSQDHNKYAGTIRYSSISEKLARGIRRLCLELGIPASINKQKYKIYDGSVINKIETGDFNYYYSVHIPASQSIKLYNYSYKVKKYEKTTSSRIFTYGKYILFPILGLEEINDFLDVTNLRVENDETYQILDYIVHNCSICGTRPRKVEQRCDHLKYYLNRVLSDGRKVYAISEKPNFFDISIVIRPADETAYALKKVASNWNEAPNITIKEEEKEIVESNRNYLAEMGLDILSFQIVPFMEISERKIPNSVLDSIATEPIEKIACTATSLGIVLKPEEWQRLYLIHNGFKKEAEEYDLKNIIMSYPDNYNDSDNHINNIFDIENYSSYIAHRLKSYFEQRTIFNPIWANRLNGFVKIAATAPGHMVSREKKYTATDIIVPAGLSYLGYRFLLGKAGKDPIFLKKIIELLKKSPLLALLLLGAGAKATANMINLAQPYSYPPVPKGLIKQSVISTDMLKKTVADWWRPVLVALGASHLWAAESKRKERLGYPPGVISNFIAENPNLSAVLGAIALKKGISTLNRRKIVKGLTKTSIDQDLSLQNHNLGLQDSRFISKIDQFKLRESLGVNLIDGSLPQSLLDPDLFKGTAELLSTFSSGN